jgi:Ankyrin repeats (many copies)
MKHPALVRAAKRGDVIAVRRLLAAGADANATSGGYSTALNAAVARGNTPVVALLLEAGAKPDKCTVQVAAFANHAKTLRVLLAFGAQPHGPNRTPLLNALNWSGLTRQQQARVRQLLREAGARELPDWYLRWRWSVTYGWRLRLRRFLYSLGWRPKFRRRSN